MSLIGFLIDRIKLRKKIGELGCMTISTCQTEIEEKIENSLLNHCEHFQVVFYIYIHKKLKKT